MEESPKDAVEDDHVDSAEVEAGEEEGADDGDGDEGGEYPVLGASRTKTTALRAKRTLRYIKRVAVSFPD